MPASPCRSRPYDLVHRSTDFEFVSERVWELSDEPAVGDAARSAPGPVAALSQRSRTTLGPRGRLTRGYSWVSRVTKILLISSLTCTSRSPLQGEVGGSSPSAPAELEVVGLDRSERSRSISNQTPCGSSSIPQRFSGP